MLTLRRSFVDGMWSPRALWLAAWAPEGVERVPGDGQEGDSEACSCTEFSIEPFVCDCIYSRRVLSSALSSSYVTSSIVGAVGGADAHADPSAVDGAVLVSWDVVSTGTWGSRVGS